MAASPEQCKFTAHLSREHYECRRLAEKDGLCFFHLPKTTETEDEYKEFEDRFLTLVKEIESDSSIDNYDFRGFCFPTFRLYGRTFKKTVNFAGTIFYFTFGCSSTFEHSVDFSQAIFKSNAHFAGAKFLEKADFSFCSFEGRTAFLTEFWQEVSFENCSFLNRVTFQGVRSVQLVTDCNFCAIDISREAVVTFSHFDLAMASFLDTNVEVINFRGVQWYRRPNRRTSALWDEFRPLSRYQSEREFEKLAENYRQLVRNYERNRDFNTAEDFYIGEMEIGRKKQGLGMRPMWRRRLSEWVNPYACYRVLSNYGSSWIQALLVLLTEVFLISAFILYSGFRFKADILAKSFAIMEYNIFPDLEYHAVSFGQWVSDYGQAILVMLSIATFQRQLSAEPASAGSQFWMAVSPIIFAGQGALLILSIKRRFRR